MGLSFSAGNSVTLAGALCGIWLGTPSLAGKLGPAADEGVGRPIAAGEEVLMDNGGCVRLMLEE